MVQVQAGIKIKRSLILANARASSILASSIANLIIIPRGFYKTPGRQFQLPTSAGGSAWPLLAACFLFVCFLLVTLVRVLYYVAVAVRLLLAFVNPLRTTIREPRLGIWIWRFRFTGFYNTRHKHQEATNNAHMHPNAIWLLHHARKNQTPVLGQKKKKRALGALF